MSEILSRAALGTAARLAAGGSYEAAGRLLDTCDPAHHALDILLLRAKMAAQQGRYREAIAHWEEVLQMQPDHAEAQRGISLARRLAGNPGSSFYLRASLIYALLFAVIAALGIALVASFLGRNREINALRSQVEEQRELLATVRASGGTGERDAPPRPVDEKLGDLRLAVDGATLRRNASGLALVFSEGLFRRGIELTPEARTALTSLARQLEPWAGRVAVTVVGHTDDAPLSTRTPHRDNAALGMARAAAAVEHLRASAALPAGMFSIRGLGEISAPFDNDAPAGRARNRTVTFHFTPAEVPVTPGPR